MTGIIRAGKTIRQNCPLHPVHPGGEGFFPVGSPKEPLFLAGMKNIHQ